MKFQPRFQMTSSVFTALIQRAAIAIAALLCASSTVRAASFEEPSTTFYGKVWGVGSAQPFLVGEGDLTWTIRSPDGVSYQLSSELFDLNNGEYSYRLDVPHEAIAAGLGESDQSVAMSGSGTTLEHWAIEVDGLPATILGPAGVAFSISQAMRASTYRLDLAVPLDAVDSDGNGIPDWWEELYGTGLADVDVDGDGLNGLGEYLSGYDPNHDNRIPSLVTEEIRVFGGATTIVQLEIIDSDTAPSDVVVELIRAPENGRLSLRNEVENSEAPDVVLDAGAMFSQEDISMGRLVYDDDGEEDFGVFQVALRDGVGTIPVATNDVQILVYRPVRELQLPPVPALADVVNSGVAGEEGLGSKEIAWMLGYSLGDELGFVIGDLSWSLTAGALRAPTSDLSSSQYANEHVPAFGEERRHFLLGGASDDSLAGGHNVDVLVGGPGDDTLRGGAGGDVFLYLAEDFGADQLSDFSPDESDHIDLTAILNGESSLLPDYLRVVPSGADTKIEIDADGVGGIYTDASLLLTDIQWDGSDLYSLLETGVLITGNKQMPSRVSIGLHVAGASENGPQSGTFRVSRSGDHSSAITVNLQITGSAANGADYAWVDDTVVIAAGERHADIDVTPYSDGVTESDEIVAVRVLAGTGYDLDVSDRAQLVIEDLAPLISLEVLEPLAVRSTGQAAYILVKRTGVIDQSVLLRMGYTGSALNGSDYDSQASFIQLSAGQTSHLLTFTPKQTAELSANGSDVVVTVLPSGDYKIGEKNVAAVVLIHAEMSLGTWMANEFPGNSGTPEDFANGDHGATGYSNLTRYAYGLDPLAPEAEQGIPQFGLVDGQFYVIFRKPVAITDVQYIVELGDEDFNWRSDSSAIEPFYPAELGSDAGLRAYRSIVTAEDASIQFMRVRLIYQP